MHSRLNQTVHYEYIGNNTLVIDNDSGAENPREHYDHLFSMALGPSQHHLLNEEKDIAYRRHYESHYYHAPRDDWKDVLKNYLKDKDSRYVVYAIKSYEHGGITLSLTHLDDTAEAWDYSIFGLMFVKKADITKELGAKRFSKKMYEYAEKVAKAELEGFSNYLNGDVYFAAVYEGHLAEDAYLDTADSLESMYGFYTLEHAIESGREIANAVIKRVA